jgi:hypothetical protein
VVPGLLMPQQISVICTLLTLAVVSWENERNPQRGFQVQYIDLTVKSTACVFFSTVPVFLHAGGASNSTTESPTKLS